MLHYFNPGHETAALNESPHYTPPAIQVKMQRDLGFLPSWYAREGEGVWLDGEWDASYADFLAARQLPQAQVICQANVAQRADWLSGRELALWGIAPHSLQFFKRLNDRYQLQIVLPEWKPEYKVLCSRLSAKSCLEYLIENIPGLSPDMVPVYHTSSETLIACLKEAAEQRLVKSPYSSSGRGLLWLAPGEPDRASLQLLQGMLKRQSMVSLEKVLDKQLDFSMQFSSDGKGTALYQGLSLFKTDAKGNYQTTWIASQSRIEDEIARIFPDWPQYEPLCRENLSRFLSAHFAHLYKGNIGVDMLLYNENGKLRLHPCVEINLRATMGFLALRLHKRLYNHHSTASFYIDYSPLPGETWKRHRKMQEQYPLKTCEGKVLSGYLPLCPVGEDSRYRAYLVETEPVSPPRRLAQHVASFT